MAERLTDTRETVEAEFKYAAFDDAIDTAEALGVTRAQAINAYIATIGLTTGKTDQAVL